MALVTVQRSPSPSNTPDTLSSDLGDGLDQEDGSQKSPLKSCKSKSALKRLQKFFNTIRFVSRLRFSESYLAVKGAALILPQSECPRAITRASHGGDIQTHLQSMFYLLRPQDTIKVAVKIESSNPAISRYMAVVTTVGRQDTDESVILGVDIDKEKATIGLVLPIWGDMVIKLDGDGGFRITCQQWYHVFKPVSVQAMWSALQTLLKVQDLASQQSYYPGGLTHTWMSYYEVRINSSQACIQEWNIHEDIESFRKDFTDNEPTERANLEKQIKVKLKEVMMGLDLEEVTCRFIRLRVEEEMGMNLKEYRQYIDEEMLTVLGQMDAASQIFDFLYLGSEWNASNLEELKANGVGYILNITREIDNFFLGMFKYYNIRLYDVEQSELLKHWDDTYRFISQARKNNSKVLVHCKMGMSRSASTVIAYAMKEYGWSLDFAHSYVKQKRSVIRPNRGFMAQLETYQGILDASKQRHNLLFRSASAGNLKNQASQREDDSAPPDGKREHSVEIDILRHAKDDLELGGRPRSWSPEDGVPQILMKAQDLGSDCESTDDDHTAAAYADYQLALEAEEFEDLTSIPFTLDNCDEYDISSRSADSLDIDEGHPDSAFETQFDFGNSNIVLLSQKTLQDSIAELGDRLEDHPSEDESDVEDFVQRDMPPKREWGYYDVSMLTELEEEREENMDENDSLLHPDEMLESILSQQKKQLRIAQLLKLSQTKRREEATIVYAQSSEDSATRPSAINRVRPDDYWIKDIPPSPSPKPEPDPDPSDCELQTEMPETPSASVVSTKEHSTKSDEAPTTSSALHLTPKTPETSDVSPAKTQAPPSPEEIPLETAAETCQEDIPETVKTSKEIGILQHYQKEEIPWKQGMVKRQKEDFEHKIKRELDLKDGSTCSRSSVSSVGSDLDLDSPEEDRPQTESKGESGAVPSPARSPEKEETQPEVGGAVFDLGNSTPPGSPKPSREGERPTSIYETEDIELEPGIVQRTRLVIEERERSSSFTELSTRASDSKPVQRSASVRMERSARLKDRSSERRKTCLPVLTPSSSKDDLLGGGGDPVARGTRSAGNSPEKEVRKLERDFDLVRQEEKMEGKKTVEEEGEDGAVVKVIKIGEEDVEMEAGIVKRHTKDFEQLQQSKELSKEDAEVLASLETLSLAVPRDHKREESTSPCLQEEEISLIRSGSVKRQKQEIESKYGASDPKRAIMDANIDESATETVGGQDGEEKHGITVKKTPELQEGETENSADCSKPTLIITAETPEHDLERGDQTKSRSSSVGTPAYPDEDIEWSVGTVKQHKAAIESKAKEMETSAHLGKKPADDGNRKLMSPKTLFLIQAVGSEWSASPTKSKRQTAATPKGKGLVRKLSTEIESRSDKDVAGSNSETEEKCAVFQDLESDCSVKVKRSEGGAKAEAASKTEGDSNSAVKTVPAKEASDLEGTGEGHLQTSSPVEEVKVKSLMEIFEQRDSSAKLSTSTSHVKSEGHSKVDEHATRKKDTDRHGDSPVKKYAKRGSASARPKSFSGQTATGRERSDFARKKSPDGEETRPRTRSQASFELEAEKKSAQPVSDSSPFSGRKSAGLPSPTLPQGPSLSPRKARKLQGKSHPLSKLTGELESQSPGRTPNPLYNTM